MKTYCLYHAACWDGFCAAWVARKKLPADTEFIPVNYGQPEPEMECGSVVYILDFSYKREVMKNIISQMSKVVVLDHHKIAEKELAGLMDEFARPGVTQHYPCIKFDMNKSGARLTWEYFFKDSPPWLVEYTEDRDLWIWGLHKSREINANLRSYPLDFQVWDDIIKTLGSHAFTGGFPSEVNEQKSWIKAGEAILRREQQIIDSHVSFAREEEIDGYKVLIVNATVLTSEIAGELAKGRPFGVCFFERKDCKLVFSLRSTPDGVDVSEIAKCRGGGGHKHAAGYEVGLSLPDLELVFTK